MSVEDVPARLCVANAAAGTAMARAGPGLSSCRRLGSSFVNKTFDGKGLALKEK
jgi:hypothetical protein